MNKSLVSKLAFAVVLGAVSAQAPAGNRSIRVDGFGDWDLYLTGTPNCPGTTAGATASATLLNTLGHTFAGLASAAYTVDDYCQVPTATALTKAGYFYSDEADLATMFDDGRGMSGVRYSFFDHPRFDFENPPTGFQWSVFNFPTGISIVGLYGLQNITLSSSSSYISGGVWGGGNAVYDGRYFCFRGSTYLGTWNGSFSDTASPCLKAADHLFRGNFDP